MECPTSAIRSIGTGQLAATSSSSQESLRPFSTIGRPVL